MTAERKKEEPKAESMGEEDTKKKVDSTTADNRKPNYSFAWPEQRQKEPNLLCDLVS